MTDCLSSSTSWSNTVFTPGSECGRLPHISHLFLLFWVRVHSACGGSLQLSRYRKIRTWNYCKSVKSSRAKLPCCYRVACDACYAQAILHVHWPSCWKSIWTFGLCGWGKMCKHREKICDDTGRSRGEEKGHLLDSVLGVCFSLPTNRRGRVQEAVLPDGISAIAIKSLDHLEVRRRKKSKDIKIYLFLTFQPQGEAAEVAWPFGFKCTCPHLQLRGWPRRMSQMPDLGAMSAQPSMDAAALVADQHASVYRGPTGLCNRAKIVTRLQSNYRSACKTSIFTIIVTSGRILGKGCNGQHRAQAEELLCVSCDKEHYGCRRTNVRQ